MRGLVVMAWLVVERLAEWPECRVLPCPFASRDAVERRGEKTRRPTRDLDAVCGV